MFSYFQDLIITNKAVINIHVEVYMQTCALISLHTFSLSQYTDPQLCRSVLTYKLSFKMVVSFYSLINGLKGFLLLHTYTNTGDANFKNLPF